jgi:hypothetical protein
MASLLMGKYGAKRPSSRSPEIAKLRPALAEPDSNTLRLRPQR